MSSVLGRDSSSGAHNSDLPEEVEGRRELGAQTQIWLDGDVLSCACPGCSASMAIRLWLRLAECDMCGAQMELTVEQERLARRLLENGERPQAGAGPWSNPVGPHSGSEPRLRPLQILSTPTSSAQAKSAAAQPSVTSSAAPTYVAQPVVDTSAVAPISRARPAAADRSRRLGRRLLEQLTAALLSMILNMLAVIVLGLIFFPQQQDDRIALNVDFSPPPSGPPPGDLVAHPVPDKPAQPLAAVDRTKPAPSLKVPELAAQRARSREAVQKLTAAVRPLPHFRPTFGAGSPIVGTLLAGRDPAARAKIVLAEGGNNETELAVARGLKWIAKHQNPDGSWSLDAFDACGDCGGQCTHPGLLSDTAGTALALLPFLGAGYTHRNQNDYREQIERGLLWLVAEQREDGDLRGRGYGNMYAHGQAAIVLCEAYALTNDSKLRDAAQKAIDFIVSAQHPAGGWRYEPREPGDLSVVGWQIMALRSARMAKLAVPDDVFERSNRFLDAVQEKPSQGLYSYMRASGATDAMTAEGLLCRLYSGWRTNHPQVVHGADWLLKEHLPSEDAVNMYYWYYGSQVMHHLGGNRWKKWNDRMRRILVDLQEAEGHMAGSWTPHGGHDENGGRLYMTALAVCTLEVYYRHLPIYKNQALVGGK